MNKQQLYLVLDQIDPRYLDEAAGYRGRSPKRAARTLLIAAVILAYRGKSLLTVSLAASAAVMLTEWALVIFA